ncbi:hypothetical protein B0A48_00077 [Cryoendolithus antarcticus]|uniref:C3H1-type domain-containing protein n=1 Tax=Cryoendolithus antarcticus TaxID=1507870 RepID=A0A1V8TTL1_9PEZI|nr:hypothetical protein B0A48_00077 [Cryoendolithus antarcticus]
MANYSNVDLLGLGNGDSTHINTPHPNGIPAMANNITGSNPLGLWERHEELRLAGVKRTVLLEEVITRYENLSLKHAELVREHDVQRTYTATAHAREQGLTENVKRLQYILNRDPFVLVLIDGDGMIFRESFLRDGEKGGRQAALILKDEVKKWFDRNIPDPPKDYKIVTRIYANVKGLADACVRAGLIDQASTFQDFTQGFTSGGGLFDWVDVGSGKDRADVKIIDNLKLHLYDYHCHQVLFGCSHDNGFARMLETYMDDPEALARVTLLEGVLFEKELADLPFKTTRFPGLFRGDKINTTPPDLLNGQRGRQLSQLSAASGLLTPRMDTPASFISASKIGDSLARQVGLPPLNTSRRADSSASSSLVSPTDSVANLMLQDSWAAKAKRAANLPPPEPAPRPLQGPADIVRRNRKGQRIDSSIEYESDAFSVVKKLKLCNQHYLMPNGCNKSHKCHHRHDYRPTEKETKILRAVARGAPTANYGSAPPPGGQQQYQAYPGQPGRPQQGGYQSPAPGGYQQPPAQGAYGQQQYQRPPPPPPGQSTSPYPGQAPGQYGQAPPYPPDNSYGGGYGGAPPQGQQGYGAPPQGQQGYGAPQGGQQYGGQQQQYPPQGGAGGAGGAPHDIAGYTRQLEQAIQEKQLQQFYHPGDPRLPQIAQRAAQSIDRLCQAWRIQREIAVDIVRLALYDVIVFIDDSGSMSFEENGERIKDLQLIMQRVAFAATLFDDDGIDVRFMNDEEIPLNALSGIRGEQQINQILSTKKYKGLTPFGTKLREKVVDGIALPKLRQPRKPILIIGITDGQPAGENQNALIETIRYAMGATQNLGPGAIAFEFAQVGNDEKATQYLAKLDNDPQVGRMVDCTSNYENESAEMSRAQPPVDLTPDLWMLKLILGAIDPSYDTKDEKTSMAGGAPGGYGGAPLQQYGAPQGQYPPQQQGYGAPPQQGGYGQQPPQYGGQQQQQGGQYGRPPPPQGQQGGYPGQAPQYGGGPPRY